jgi:hypothetical protein
MKDFDPNRIASEWHSGQGSALYAYASTDRIPTEEFKDRLVGEIERCMTHADDEGLDDLEYLLMHVEEQHPDRFPGSEMHEDDSSDDAKCEGCGGMKTEGTCECSMIESKRTLSAAIRQIVHEMKLGVAGVNPYGFGGASKVDDDVDMDHFLLSKNKAPAPAESGVKKKSKDVSKAKPKRKSKKIG